MPSGVAFERAVPGAFTHGLCNGQKFARQNPRCWRKFLSAGHSRAFLMSVSERCPARISPLTKCFVPIATSKLRGSWGMSEVSLQAQADVLPTGHAKVRAPRPLSAPAVTILLCTFNGERFLAEQLASLEQQTFTNWKLIASDDGSTDRTKSILLGFQKSFAPGKIEIIDGPRRGAPAHFLFQACAENLASEYYAFCDQDDVWEADKLARAIEALEQTDPGIPALYGSRTRLVDEDGNEIGLSPLFQRKPEFRSALVQSIAGGNTIVFNQKARELLVFCGADVDVPSHDWWLYQVTSACGGKVHYDAWPSVRYRQHEHNVIGSNMGWTARVRRLHMLKQGRFRHWEDLNVVALARIRPRMTAENQRIFGLFCKARHEPLLRRATIFAQAGVYRQTLLGNLGLVAAVVLNKI
jgi:glycosyltransferase involved in cell wall biosynthesis